MKDTRFIELLNQYVDQQLTATEATELEAELQHNPESRRTYQQYCRMQKACTQLFEQERRAAPETSKLSRALADADRKVGGVSGQRTVWRQRGVFAAGLSAMAACVAFVLVRQAPVLVSPSVASTPSKAAVAVVEQPAPAIQTVAIPPADPQSSELRRTFRLLLPARQFVPVQVLAINSGAVNAVEAPTSFEWMKHVELAPMRDISADDNALDANDSIPQVTGLYIHNSGPVQGFYEKAAFQFQKDK